MVKKAQKDNKILYQCEECEVSLRKWKNCEKMRGVVQRTQKLQYRNYKIRHSAWKSRKI